MSEIAREGVVKETTVTNCIAAARICLLSTALSDETKGDRMKDMAVTVVCPKTMAGSWELIRQRVSSLDITSAANSTTPPSVVDTFSAACAQQEGKVLASQIVVCPKSLAGSWEVLRRQFVNENDGGSALDEKAGKTLQTAASGRAAFHRSPDQQKQQDAIINEWKPAAQACPAYEPMSSEMCRDAIRLWRYATDRKTTTMQALVCVWPKWHELGRATIDHVSANVRLHGGQMSYESFYDCAGPGTAFMSPEWGKVDRDGKSCNNEWWIEQDVDAWMLTENENCSALFHLPFPHPIIMLTMKFLSARRFTSVRDVEFFCQWLSVLVGPSTHNASSPAV